MAVEYDIDNKLNIEELTKWKEQIKDTITSPISWQKRIELYQMVQFINQRIAVLSHLTRT